MSRRNLTPEEEFVEALRAGAGSYGFAPDDASAELLKTYFVKVGAWNARLHLVAPCSPSEFATRHVLESLLAARFLAPGARLVDVGSGAGLPAVPLLVARPDIEAVLIEASAKKSVFLREALSAVRAETRARVVAERFEKTPPPESDALTCRALERFTEVLPALVEWSARVPTLLLFGGPSLRERIEEAGLAFDPVLAPGSERRYLFVVRR